MLACVLYEFLHELNGIPATGNAYLQRDILKERVEFDGFVSDWGL
jgi:beta-glucosidase